MNGIIIRPVHVGEAPINRWNVYNARNILIASCTRDETAAAIADAINAGDEKQREIDRLKADLDAALAERDAARAGGERMREALGALVIATDAYATFHGPCAHHRDDCPFPPEPECALVESVNEALATARAALEAR